MEQGGTRKPKKQELLATQCSQLDVASSQQTARPPARSPQVVKAKAYHAEARQLGAQLRRMTAKAAKLKKAAAALRWASMGQCAVGG